MACKVPPPATSGQQTLEMINSGRKLVSKKKEGFIFRISRAAPALGPDGPAAGRGGVRTDGIPDLQNPPTIEAAAATRRVESVATFAGTTWTRSSTRRHFGSR